MTVYRLTEMILRLALHVLFRGRVQAGPFRGMRYAVTSYGGWYPKIFGSYEYKVQEWLVERLRSSPAPALFWDVGAAEGFYAIGAALNEARVVAWEGEEPKQSTIRAMARVNGVAPSIDLRGYCTADELISQVDSQDAPDIVIMDVEGSETNLVTETLLSKLPNTAFMIELHGVAATQHVRDVFSRAGLHGTVFDHQPWGVDQWPHFRLIPKKVRDFLLTERRSPGGNPYYVYVPSGETYRSQSK